MLTFIFGTVIELMEAQDTQPKQNIMKKLVLIAAVGMFAISCGTKESSMSTSNSDSVKVDNTATMAPAATDTMTTGNPDSIKMKMDTAATAR